MPESRRLRARLVPEEHLDIGWIVLILLLGADAGGYVNWANQHIFSYSDKTANFCGGFVLAASAVRYYEFRSKNIRLDLVFIFALAFASLGGVLHELWQNWDYVYLKPDLLPFMLTDTLTDLISVLAGGALAGLYYAVWRPHKLNLKQH
ncbi:MAG: hypothetical protein AAB527_01875 [Patescibacteria group bacterium]